MVRLREIKKRSKEIVERYREDSKDQRKFPEFHIWCLNEDASQGKIHLYRRPKGKDDVYSEEIAYNSFPELIMIIESLGNAWKATM